MVLFKRKPVQYYSKPPLLDHTECWVIEETDECFRLYEDYLRRMEFYRQRRFMCEITGHSGLSFKEALRSEKEASGEVDDAFPDSLREPILRKVQFMQMPRIDHLVDFVFEEFKSDFYLKEKVIVTIDEERYTGSIRAKTKFPELIKVDGTIEREATARYFVELEQRPGEEAVVEPQALSRERKTFTKLRLRTYLKNAVTREAWTGAPWIVKPKLAEEYRLPTEVPSHLTQEAQAKFRKAAVVQNKKGEYEGPVLHFPQAYGPQQSFPAIKPKGSKNAHQEELRARQLAQLQNSKGGHANHVKGQSEGSPGVNGVAGGRSPSVNGYHPIAAKNQAKQAPIPPPPPKYPIEDLELTPTRDGTHRPALKFLSQDTPTVGRISEGEGNGITMESVGLLLETWNTLNVYCQVYTLDSFTFDDFIEALRFTSEDVQCTLLVEIHCAVLKKLVNDFNDKNGQVQIRLPYQPDSDEESEEEETAEPSPEPEPEIARPTTRSTRSSLMKAEAAELRDATNELSLNDEKIHRAAEMDHSTKGYDWKMRLRKRDFREGRWVVIIVGLLNAIAGNPRMAKACNDILRHLAPLDQDATPEVAFAQYQSMDINLRILVLQIICLESVETKAIRQYMEDCSAQMTEYRKNKNEETREKKAAIEELRQLQEERKALIPEEEIPSPSAEKEEASEEQEAGAEEEEEEEAEPEEVPDSDGSSPHQGRRRRANAGDRATARKHRLAQEEKRAAAEAEKLKKPSKEEKQLQKIDKKIEKKKEQIRNIEETIAVFENDLREADCPRTRCLGKDRFWNRYYWMERNAMPYGGLPDSSTAGAGYANGCVWVEGPDDMERIGFIELSDEENAQYKRAFQMTVPERKMKEEGDTHVFSARQWGFYDDPDSLDMLIGWLDIRGVRELKLRKELQLYREKITYHMRKRQEYLTPEREKSEAANSEPVTRVSTRTKTYLNNTSHRCLAWKNTAALRAHKHLHSESGAPASTGRPRGVAQKKAVQQQVEEEEVVPVARSTRGAAKTAEKNAGKRTASGRLPTRQGSRYNF